MGNSIFDAIQSLARAAVKQFLTIQFTPEQKAKVKGVLGVEVPFGQVPLRAPGITPVYGIKPPAVADGPNMPPVVLKYGMPLGPTHPPLQRPAILPMYAIKAPAAERVYLTQEQRRQIRSATGCSTCDYFEIQPGMRLLYGMPLIHE